MTSSSPFSDITSGGIAMRLPVNGAELEVEVLGDEDAPVLIAHHGAPGLGSRAEPKSGFGALADTYRVIVFDARGSGESSDTPPYSHEQWTADIDALREWAGADTIIMGGGPPPRGRHRPNVHRHGDVRPQLHRAGPRQ